MAIYHLSSKIFTRSKGHSVCAAAAYRSGEKIIDQNTGEIHDYRRKQQVDYSRIIAPKNAPKWALQRERLWNEVEAIEKRKDSQVAREYEMALPIELKPEERVMVAIGFASGLAEKMGMVVDFNIHHLYGDNPHVHMLCTTRTITPEGFGKKNRTWNTKEFLELVRGSWAFIINGFLAKNNIDNFIDHRSYERQLAEGTACANESPEQTQKRLKSITNRLPQIHKGKALHHMEKKGASNLEQFERFNEYQRRLQFNNEYQEKLSEIEVEIKADNDFMAGFNAWEESERQRKQQQREQDEADLLDDMYEAYRDGSDMSQFSSRFEEETQQTEKDKPSSLEQQVDRKRSRNNDDDFSPSF